MCKGNWTILAAMTAIATMNQSGRFILGFVASYGNMLDDTDTSYVEYGALSGPIFLFPYGIFQVFAGRLVDRISSPKWLLIISSLIWNVMIGMEGLATNFGMLVWPRVIFALVSCVLDTTGFMFVGAFFTHENRGTASSTYALAIYIGSALAAFSIVITMLANWRAVFFIYGALGIIVTLLSIPVLKNPPKQIKEESDEVPSNWRADCKELVKNNTLVITLIAITIRFIAGFCRGFFEPLVFAYNYPEYELYYSISTTIILIIAPIPGFFWVAGYTDRKEKTNPSIRPKIVSITLLIPVIFFPIMYYCGIFAVSIICLFITYTVGEIYLPIGFVIALNVTTPRIRALQTGLILFTSTIGSSIVVLGLGQVTSSLGGSGLTLVMTIIQIIGYSSGGVLFWYWSKFYEDDLAKDSDEKSVSLLQAEMEASSASN